MRFFKPIQNGAEEDVKMNNLICMSIGFVFGIIVTLYIGLREMVGKLTKDKTKKLYKVFWED